ncbi:thermonuclease family protein [Desulfoprunum benzoelyticum]|uniref:Endonuclease YncB(Thermonuclease family) n=1 Tax=Desulfoprunum benzoelyticum TaxID=1506996 RepID=A0A840UJV9_9BACT|nr:thermonuclease family protein [Desulfoprunum benzoelyticum]MBB5346627.1 endonuclease YncB(thermonuclease family) [Desulfoprunum benzoelyticum]MBM9529127.1 thermonuclease family protein [Desulfoprunum benzoelyticum]
MIRIQATRRILALVGVVLVVLGGGDACGEESAVISRVVDGDSLKVRQHNRSFQIRLWGIDTPEHGQRYAAEARSQCRRIVAGKKIVLQPKYLDKYNRVVALVWVDGMLLNEELVRRGAAWVYDRYCDEEVCQTWNDLEQEARVRRIGLWRDDSPVAPWEWKGRQRSGRPRPE